MRASEERAQSRGGCLPPLAVAAVMLVVAMGGYVVAGSIQSSGPVAVGPDVTIQPPLGWVEVPDSAHVRALGRGMPSSEFTDGSSSLIVAAATTTDTGALLAAYLAGALEQRLEGLAHGQAPGRAPEGGVAVTYSGVIADGGGTVDGEVIVVPGPDGAAALFDGWAPEGSWTFARDDVVEIASSVRFG